MARKYGAGSLSLAVVFAMFAALFSTGTHLAQAASETIVIGQVYGGGGNSGATYTNDFIELFNHGTTAVSLNGWSVQYASATGTTWQKTALTNVTLQPGQYYLVQQAQGAGGTVNLPTPDATGTIAMSNSSGKVALVSSTIALSGGCPTTVVDFVGFGGANCSESSPTPALTNSTAALRASNGCTDTDNNGSDFATGAPAPRNSASSFNICGTEPSSSASPSPSPSASPSPSPSPSPACPTETHLISAIQGSGSSTSVTGSVTVQGVVTGIFPGLNTINLQEEAADDDGNSATSEGIAVFMGSSFRTLTSGLEVGEVVSINGTAGDRSTSGGALQTQISGTATSPITVTECGLSATVAPVDVSFPLTNVSDLERYESMLVHFPQNLFIAEYFNYDRFGEIVLGYADDISELGGTGRFYNPTSITTPGSAANALAAKYALRRITLDDGISASPPTSPTHPNGQPFSATNSFRGGDTVSGTTGVIEHSFGVYRLQPTNYGTYTAKNSRDATPEDVGGSLKVASYNVLNYFLTIDTTSDSRIGDCGPSKTMDCRGADSQVEFDHQRSKLLKALETINADVYGLIELENTTGVEPMDDIVKGLNATFGEGTFAYVNTGTVGTDAIKVGIIYKPGKVTPIGVYQTLDESDDPRFDTDRNRPALAQTFEEKATGARFTLVVNHLKSKGSGCGTTDPNKNDGQGNCNLTRKAAAEALVDWLATDPTGSNDSDFLIVGDLNAYAKEDPITGIKIGSDDTANTADDYINLIEDRLGTYAYSYVFDGQAGYLDHALANVSLNSQVTGITDWHLNSDEPDIFDYNDTVQDTGESSNERKGIDVTDAQSPFRTSDHDPVIVGLKLNAPPVAVDDTAVTRRNTSVAIFALSNDTDLEGDQLSVTSFTQPSNGTVDYSKKNNNFRYTPKRGFSGTDVFTYTIRDGKGGSSTATVTITVGK